MYVTNCDVSLYSNNTLLSSTTATYNLSVCLLTHAQGESTETEAELSTDTSTDLSVSEQLLFCLVVVDFMLYSAGFKVDNILILELEWS